MEHDFSVRKYAEALFAKYGLSPHFEYEIGSIPLFTSLLMSGMGIGLLPRPHAQPYIDSGLILAVDTAEELPKEHIFLISPKAAGSGALRRFIRHISENTPTNLQGHSGIR